MNCATLKRFAVAAFVFMLALVVPLSIPIGHAQTGTATLNIIAGWNLVGMGSSGSLDVATTLGDATKVTTVWKWVPSKSNWAFYAPSLVGQQLTDYATGKGYDVLTTVNGGEGFWVNAKTPFTAQLPAGTAISSVSYRSNLATGWNLIATGDNLTPSQFNRALSVTPAAEGEIPINLTTLWAWDATQTNWYFYAPSLEISGGLASYVASKSYLEFGSKALGPTMGFWVNVPLTGASSAPTGVTATAGNGQMTISWSAVSGATSYNIYWSTTSGVTKSSGTKIAGATSPHSHPGLTNGTTYYYIVTAVNSSGESAESAQVSATLTAVQDPPLKLFNAGVRPWIYDIIEDSLNNILVAGTQDDGQSIVVLKLNSAGAQVWNKYFPAGTGVNTNNIFEVPSQGYLVTGGIASTTGSLFKMLIDQDGTNSAPSYFFPDCGYPNWATGPLSSDSVRLSDGSVIFAGGTHYENNCGIFIDYSNAVITGINSSGTQYFWNDYNYASGYSESFESVIALSGGGFAAAGRARLYDGGDGYSGPDNAILVKTDSLGSVIWTKNYGYKTADDGNTGILDLIQTSDNGYAMLAWSGSYYDMYVIKADSNGNSTSAFNAATGDFCYRGRKFVQSGDNGFVIVGRGAGCHGAVVKMSAAGAKVWEYNLDSGEPTAIVKSASGGYLIAGSVGVDPTSGAYKIFVFKLDDFGKRVW